MTATPRTSRGRATRERILAAATALIAERGVAATTLEDVCRATPASKSQLYLYFADREELLRGVAHATVCQVMEQQAAGLAAFSSSHGIRAYFDAIVAVGLQREGRGGCPIGSLAGQLAECDDAARRELADGLSAWRLGLAAGLGAMAERGELAPDVDVDRLAAQTLALIQGGLLLAQVHRDPEQVRLATDAAEQLITDASARAVDSSR